MPDIGFLARLPRRLCAAFVVNAIGHGPDDLDGRPSRSGSRSRSHGVRRNPQDVVEKSRDRLVFGSVLDHQRRDGDGGDMG
jgi:hypothetical protein